MERLSKAVAVSYFATIYAVLPVPCSPCFHYRWSGLASAKFALSLSCALWSHPGRLQRRLGPEHRASPGLLGRRAPGPSRLVNTRFSIPARSGPCIRLPAAGSSGAEHLYIPLATAGQETPDGVSAPDLPSGTAVATASAPQLPSPRLSAFQSPQPAEAFHSMLRSRERSLAEDGSRALFDNGRVAARAAPPVVGEQRTFNVCSSSSCTGFVQSTATAQIGRPAGRDLRGQCCAGRRVHRHRSGPGEDPLRSVPLSHRHGSLRPRVGHGRERRGDRTADPAGKRAESGLQHNRAYYPGLLLRRRPAGPGSNNPGSNDGEVFYGLVPDVNNSRCQVSKEEANSKLPATFIHEFQHMISYNQHVLLRDGSSEDTWLNEGLSHFAEELGGREVPDAQCAPTSCEEEFLGQGDLLNALEYLASPEDFYLIEPGNSTGQLEERGANWLFVRWLADHFGEARLGTELTRELLATSQTGQRQRRCADWRGLLHVGRRMAAHQLSGRPAGVFSRWQSAELHQLELPRGGRCKRRIPLGA